jgi:hypothetical protein
MQQHLDVYNYDFSAMAYEAKLELFSLPCYVQLPLTKHLDSPKKTSLYYITELL